MTDNDKVPELSVEEFDNFVKKGVVFVDFFADWCMPCMMMGPIVDELSERFRKKIKFAKVNVGEEQDLALKFNVNSIPAFKVFKNGKVVEEFGGGMSAEELEAKLKNHI